MGRFRALGEDLSKRKKMGWVKDEKGRGLGLFSMTTIWFDSRYRLSRYSGSIKKQKRIVERQNNTGDYTTGSNGSGVLPKEKMSTKNRAGVVKRASALLGGFLASPFPRVWALLQVFSSRTKSWRFTPHIRMGIEVRLEGKCC